MPLLFDLTLPFKEPVWIFTTILFVILVMPILMKKIRIPGIVGLILAGVAIGPKGLGMIALDSGIKLFGTIGLLYIMFLAGLEIDFRDFQRNRNKSLVFGFLTFIIPLSIGTVTTYYFLQFSFISSLLLASMYATHTLISYPIVSRLGITRNEAVAVTVGGTIITDTAALFLLSLITLSVGGTDISLVLIKMLVSFSIFLVVVWFGFSYVARWFFKSVESEGVSQYIFTLIVVFAAGVMAELAGIEPIIGAFLAGLVLNRLVPHASVLMNRINFVGNALFIPIFLISVGMRVDLHVLFSDWNSWKVALTIIVVAYITKWLAAFFTQKIFNYTSVERQMIFGLGSSHAAATLAIILIGFDLKLFDASVLNGTILMILVTCLVSTFITESSGKKLAVKELEKIGSDTEGVERILVPVANPANFEQLIDLSIFIKNPKSQEPIYPLTVVNDDPEAKKQILMRDRLFANAIAHARAAEVNVNVVSRVDLNVAGGIIRAVKDLAISDIVIGWNGKPSAVNMFFGTIMSQVLHNCSQTIWVSKILQPINTFRRIVVIVPNNAHLETGFTHWLTGVNRLASQLGVKMFFYVQEQSEDNFKLSIKPFKGLSQTDIQVFNTWEEDFIGLNAKLTKDDLMIVVNAREHTLSFAKPMEQLPNLLSDKFDAVSFVILYPEQALKTENEGVSTQFIG